MSGREKRLPAVDGKYAADARRRSGKSGSRLRAGARRRRAVATLLTQDARAVQSDRGTRRADETGRSVETADTRRVKGKERPQEPIVFVRRACRGIFFPRPPFLTGFSSWRRILAQFWLDSTTDDCRQCRPQLADPTTAGPGEPLIIFEHPGPEGGRLETCSLRLEETLESRRLIIIHGEGREIRGNPLTITPHIYPHVGPFAGMSTTPDKSKPRSLDLVTTAAAVLVVRRRRQRLRRAVCRPSFVSRPLLEPPPGTVVMACAVAADAPAASVAQNPLPAAGSQTTHQLPRSLTYLIERFPNLRKRI